MLDLPTDIKRTARRSDLSSFSSTLESEGLLSTVERMKDVTVFAPSDRAFDAASSNFERYTVGKRKAILTYHVVKGLEYSSDLIDGQRLSTMQNQTLTVKIDDGDVYINNAKIIKTDILTSNGVLHIIDGYV